MKPIAPVPLVSGRSTRLAMVLASLCSFAACSVGDHASHTREQWDERNDPSLFSLQIMKLSDIPKEGLIPDGKFPWTDDYWATYAGGISRRWQERTWGTDYEDYLYTPIEGQRLIDTPASIDVKMLSPAEKFDLYLNRYDFPLTKFEQERTRRSVNRETNSIPTWIGLCHGWAAAALVEPEPGGKTVVKNEKGLEIPFYTSDITALMIHVYSFASSADHFAGRRCNTEEHDIKYDDNDRVIQRECRDVNPGTLHLALGQLLGNGDVTKRQGFILDLYMADQVWNHPIVGYKVEAMKIVDFERENDPLAQFRAPGTKQLARMKVDIFYAAGAAPHREPMLDQRSSYTSSQQLEYTLELDDQGRIIGGEWTGTKKHPDFMWMLTKTPKGTSLLPYDKVKELLALSRAEEAPREDSPTPPAAPAAPNSAPTTTPDSPAALPATPVSATELAVPNAPVPRF